MKYLKSALSLVQKDDFFYLILKKFSGAFPIKLIGVICTFGISIYISRTFGSNGTGIYSLTNKIIQTVVLISLFGSNTYVVKFVAQFKSSNKLLFVNNKLISLLIYVLTNGFFLTFLLYFFSEGILKLFNNFEIVKPLSVAIFSIIPITILRYFSAAFNGKMHVVLSTFLNSLFTPLIVIISIAIALVFEIRLGLVNVFYLFVCSNLFVCLISMIIWFKQLPLKHLNLNLNVGKNVMKTYHFFFINFSVFFSTAINFFIIDFFFDTKNVGLFAIALNLGNILNLIHVIIGKSLSPVIIDLIHNKKKLEKLLQKVSKILFYFCFLLFIFFLIFGKFILSIWGEEFVHSFNCLIIIVLAQLVNIISGYTGLLLINLGHEKLTSKISFFMVPLSILISLLIIPRYGIIGASLSIAFSIILENIIKYIFVKRKLNINPIKLFR